MTVSSGFFNSVNHDRLYDAEQLSSMFDGIIIDGVYENYGDAFMITANPEANSSVLVGTGRAWFDHTWTVNDSTYAMQLDPPNEMLGRIDAIVLDIDRRNDVRKNGIVYLKGSESTPDQPPTLIKEDRHNQYPLAYITRTAGPDAPVQQKDIDYQVGTAGDTPIVTGILEAQNLENLWAQLNDEFDEWWDGIKATLDENTVTNLQNQINELKEKIEGDDALVGLLTKPVYEAFKSGDYGLSSKSFSSTSTSQLKHYKDEQPTSVAHHQFEDSYCGAFILPDGCIAHAHCEYSTNGPTCMVVEILNLQGVRTVSTSSEYIVYPGLEGSYINTLNSGQNFFVMSDINSYPVKIGILMMWVPTSKNQNRFIGSLFTATISSSKNVSFEHQYYPLYEHFGVGSNGSTGLPNHVMCCHGAQLESGQFLTASGLNNGTAIVYSVSSDGVITSKDNYPLSGNLFAYGSYSGDDSLSMEAKVMANGDIVILPSYPTSYMDVYGLLDPYTLKLTIKNVGEGYSLDDLVTDYYKIGSPCSTYSAYAKRGTLKNSIQTYSNNITTEKIYDYFIGASNANIPIPEGSIVGVNTITGIVGVSSAGNHIYIGTNGGAAILTESASSNLPDENKRLLWIKGYAETAGNLIYLYLSGNAASNDPRVWKRSPGVTTIYVTTMSKE